MINLDFVGISVEIAFVLTYLPLPM